MNAELISALKQISKDRGISFEVLADAIEAALVSAYKKNYNTNGNVRANLDRETGKIEIWASKTVVETVEDPMTEISLKNAKAVNPLFEIGDVLEEEADTKNFGRIATIPQSETAFEIAKQSAMKSLQTARTTKFSVLNSYYWAKKKGWDFDINERIYKALPSMTLKDIVNFEKKNMVGKTYKYVILGDEKELDMEALGKIGPIRRLSTEEIFGY